MFEQIGTNVAVAAVTALVTFLGATIWYRSVFKEMLAEALVNHEKIWHQDSMYTHVESEINKHESRCPASTDFKAVKAALTFLVVKSGGNLSELGLDR